MNQPPSLRVVRHANKLLLSFDGRSLGTDSTALNVSGGPSSPLPAAPHDAPKERWVLTVPFESGAACQLLTGAAADGTSLLPDSTASLQEALYEKPVLAVLGRLVLFSADFLLVVNAAQRVRPRYGSGAADVRVLRHHVVWQTAEVDFIRLQPSASVQKLSDAQRQHETQLLDDIKRLLSGSDTPFFYSHSLDMSASVSHLVSTFPNRAGSALQTPEVPFGNYARSICLDGDRNLWSSARADFAWNSHMLTDFDCVTGINRDDKPSPLVVRWFPPLIEGFVGVQRCVLNSKFFDIVVISRHSKRRSGVRMHARGADDDGFAANFAETEQLFDCHSSTSTSGGELRRLSSFLQTRGSIPVTWKQDIDLKYEPKIQIDQLTSREPFLRHFEAHTESYGETIVVNLLKHKGGESALSETFQRHVQSWDQHASTLPVDADADSDAHDDGVENTPRSRRVGYVSFDLHHVCGTKNFEKLSILEEKVRLDLKRGGYLSLEYEILNDKVTKATTLSTQQNIFRTNCKDCLDRTNLVQGLFGKLSLQRQLVEAGIISSEPMMLADDAFMFIFRNVWADNGDQISTSYAGTGAIRGHVTRTGKGSVAGLIQDGQNSLVRYYLNNFQDGRKQDALSILSGTALDYPESPAGSRKMPHGELLRTAVSTPESTGVVAGVLAFLMTLLYRFAPARVGAARHFAIVALWMLIWVVLGRLARSGRSLVNLPRWTRQPPNTFKEDPRSKRD